MDDQHNYPQSEYRERCLLLLDSYQPHKSADAKEKAENLNTELVYISYLVSSKQSNLNPFTSNSNI